MRQELVVEIRETGRRHYVCVCVCGGVQVRNQKWLVGRVYGAKRFVNGYNVGPAATFQFVRVCCVCESWCDTRKVRYAVSEVMAEKDAEVTADV